MRNKHIVYSIIIYIHTIRSVTLAGKKFSNFTLKNVTVLGDTRIPFICTVIPRKFFFSKWVEPVASETPPLSAEAQAVVAERQLTTCYSLKRGRHPCAFYCEDEWSTVARF